MDLLPFRELLQQIKSKKNSVAVFGLGKSGAEALTFLKREGITGQGFEQLDSEVFYSNRVAATRLAEIDDGALFFNPPEELLREQLRGVQLIVSSPGFPLQHPWYALAEELEIPVVQEVELALSFFEGPFIAITGSNGKSTTTRLVYDLLVAGGEIAHCVGNIGRSPFELLPAGALGADLMEGVVVVELSSYQIEGLNRFSPEVGVFLNFSENHLARHGTMQSYFAAKARLFTAQSGAQYAILNSEVDELRHLAPSLSSIVRWFGGSAAEGLDAEVEYSPEESELLYLRTKSGAEFKIDTHSFPLIGKHNRMNLAAALLAIDSVNCFNEDLLDDLSHLRGLEHRLEVLNVDERLFINDSKSTTLASTIAAIEATAEQYADSDIILLVGGILKGGPLTSLVTAIEKHVSRIKQVICFGQDSQVLFDQIVPKAQTICCSTMSEATNQAIISSQSGEIVLFSPAGASFDEFTDFEERGNMFKSLVAPRFV